MEKQITTYFDEKIADCQAAVAALNGDNRADEAIFEKIRMNVYGIFRSVYDAGRQHCCGDAAKQMDFLRVRFQKLQSDWEAAYENAILHGDSEKAHIEHIKLETMAEIREKIAEWSEKI